MGGSKKAVGAWGWFHALTIAQSRCVMNLLSKLLASLLRGYNDADLIIDFEVLEKETEVETKLEYRTSYNVENVTWTRGVVAPTKVMASFLGITKVIHELAGDWERTLKPYVVGSSDANRLRILLPRDKSSHLPRAMPTFGDYLPKPKVEKALAEYQYRELADIHLTSPAILPVAICFFQWRAHCIFRRALFARWKPPLPPPRQHAVRKWQPPIVPPPPPIIYAPRPPPPAASKAAVATPSSARLRTAALSPVDVMAMSLGDDLPALSLDASLLSSPRAARATTPCPHHGSAKHDQTGMSSVALSGTFSGGLKEGTSNASYASLLKPTPVSDILAPSEEEPTSSSWLDEALSPSLKIFDDRVVAEEAFIKPAPTKGGHTGGKPPAKTKASEAWPTTGRGLSCFVKLRHGNSDDEKEHPLPKSLPEEKDLPQVHNFSPSRLKPLSVFSRFRLGEEPTDDVRDGDKENAPPVHPMVSIDLLTDTAVFHKTMRRGERPKAGAGTDKENDPLAKIDPVLEKTDPVIGLALGPIGEHPPPECMPEWLLWAF